MAKLRGTAILEHSKLQSDIILFLKKRDFDVKLELLEDIDVEDYGEEFVMEFDAAKKGLLPVNSTTGETINLQGDLSLEIKQVSKVGGNVSL